MNIQPFDPEKMPTEDAWTYSRVEWISLRDVVWPREAIPIEELFDSYAVRDLHVRAVRIGAQTYIVPGGDCRAVENLAAGINMVRARVLVITQ